MSWRELIQRALGNESAAPLRGFHSSPHRFEQFDASRIGTGEGAQSFGHGLYFAEHPDVAEYYRNTLARPTMQVGPYSADEFINSFTDPFQRGTAQLEVDLWKNRPLSAQGAARQAETYRALEQQAIIENWPDLENLRNRRSVFDQMQQYGVNYNPGTNTYEVNLHLDPRRVLHQNLPVNEQSDEIRAAIRGLGQEPDGRTADNVLARLREDFADRRMAPQGFMLGEPPPITNDRAWQDYHDSLRRALRDAQADVSTGLQQQGVQGSMYLDGVSRNAAQGTHNAVVFPGQEQNIEILRRWGLAGTLGGGTTAYGDY